MSFFTSNITYKLKNRNVKRVSTVVFYVLLFSAFSYLAQADSDSHTHSHSHSLSHSSSSSNYQSSDFYSPNSNAQPSANTLVFGSYAMGGDEMGMMQYQDGHTESVFAGSGVAVGLGWQYEPLDELGLQAKVSYFYDLADTDNGDIYFKRFPVELISYYKYGRHKLGGGLSYHLSPTYEGDQSNARFDDALGLTLQYGFKTLRGPEFGIQFTAIDYHADDQQLSSESNFQGGNKISGNSLSLFGVVAF